jgi:phosphopantothenate-cysteine ligase
MIVSFKLETDPSILVKKAQYALNKYSHHLVIGNLLLTRKWEVVFISVLDGEKWIRVPSSRRTKSFSGVQSLVGSADPLKKSDTVEADRSVSDQGGVPQGEPAVEIESLIIPEIETMHTRLIERAQSRAGSS